MLKIVRSPLWGFPRHAVVFWEASLKIQHMRTNYGPSVFHSRPTVVMTLDLERWSEVPSTAIPYFTQNLINTFPGLAEHTCSKGYDGGFVQRLQHGTYLAHIIEHMALELSTLSGISVTYGKTRYAGRSGLYEIITRFKNESGMHECLRSAVQIVLDLLEKKTVVLNEHLSRIRREISRTALGTTSAALVDAVRKRNIPYRLVGDGSLLQIGYGSKSRRLQTAVTEQTNLISADLAQDKDLTKKILEQNFLPVPLGFIARTEEDIKNNLFDLTPPYVVKPLDGNHGRGVCLNLNSLSEVQEAFRFAHEISEDVIVEEMCAGSDYRILVLDGKLIAAAERKPPSVTGDGEKTLAQLIDVLNSDPARGSGHDNVLSIIEVDHIIESHLKKINIALSDVIEKGRIVKLRENANLSSGGTASDVTDIVHPEVVAMCERAARIVGLDICGIDLIHKDITLPASAGAKIIEVNAGPGIRMHIAPSEGRGRPVAEMIIEKVMPSPENGRIPIVTVTGTNGKTTTVRLIHKIVSQKFKHVGLTTTDGIWIGKEKIYKGDTTGPRSAQVVLSDPLVDFAVLEVARGGILRSGLGYDWSDVAVVTNVSEDHIGQDGIEDVDDLVWIKSLTAERVKAGGTLVLNADDERVLAMRDRPRVVEQMLNIFLFTMQKSNAEFISHIENGGRGCCVENEWLVYYDGKHAQRLLRLKEIPATLGGKALFNVANVLAAVAASISSGISIDQLCIGLREFKSTEENLGRFNVYNIRDSYVIIDYGHNAEAFHSVGNYLNELKGYRKKVIMSLPGDRPDDLIKKCVVQVSNFCEEIYFRDDLDLRGRQYSEVPQLCLQALSESGAYCQASIISQTPTAVYKIIDQLKAGEILVIFYDNLAEVLLTILDYDPEPVDFIPEAYKQEEVIGSYYRSIITTQPEEQTNAHSF